MWPLSDAPQADYTVTVPVTVGTGNATNDLYVGARFATGAHFHGYYILLTGHTSGSVTTAIDYSLVKRTTSGSDSFFFSVGGTTSGRTATFKLSVQGTTIELFIDGTSVGSVTDSEISAPGRPYIGMDATYNAGATCLFSVASISADTLAAVATPNYRWFLMQ